MKKLNLICASIVALVGAAPAFAGVASSTANIVATENFGGSTSAAGDTVAASPVNFSLTSIAAVNNGATVYFTVRLTGGVFAQTPASNQFQFAGVTCAATVTAGTTPGCVVTRSTDNSTILVTVTSHASLTLGLGAFQYTPVVADISGVNTTLASAGNSVTASIGIQTVAPSSIELTAAQTTIDAPIGSAAIVTSQRGINGAVAASSYTGQINLTATPAGSDYTTAGYAILGQVTFTNATSAANQRGTGSAAVAAVPYTLAAGSGNAANTGATVTVTPGSGQSFPIGAQLSLSTSNTCASIFGTSQTAAFTAANAGQPRTITATGAAIVTATPYYVCMTAPSTGNTATPIQATIAATVTPASTKDAIATASGTGYNLQYNGSNVLVNTYWPAALAPFNFTGYLRVTNTGSVPAAVTATHLLPSTGAAGNAGVIIASLAAGQTVLLTSAQVEQVLGASPFGLNAARLRVTAPTNGLRVQSLLQFNNGNLVEFSNN